jgi:hypothetical protein
MNNVLRRVLASMGYDLIETEHGVTAKRGSKTVSAKTLLGIAAVI